MAERNLAFMEGRVTKTGQVIALADRPAEQSTVHAYGCACPRCAAPGMRALQQHLAAEATKAAATRAAEAIELAEATRQFEQAESCPAGCTEHAGCARTAQEAAADKAAIASMRTQLSPPTGAESLGGDNLPLACPDLPRHRARPKSEAEWNDHDLSQDWAGKKLRRWHVTYDNILFRWGEGHDPLESEYPKECIEALADPGVLFTDVVRDERGNVVDELTCRVALIRVEDGRVIPLDDARSMSAKNPFPGWDHKLMGDPREGKRNGPLTRKYALLISTDPRWSHLTHEQSREVFHSPALRAEYPELNGYRGVTREAWRKARKRLVADGLIHKPQPDEHYRKGHRWHTISRPYAPGPAPDQALQRQWSPGQTPRRADLDQLATRLQRSAQDAREHELELAMAS